MRLALTVVLALFPLSLAAQTTTGTVRGQITDQNGAPLPRAEVRATNVATGVARTAVAQSNGAYVLPGLAPATYALEVRRIGHGPQRRQVDVRIGATLTVDFALQAGAVELTAITVEAGPAVEMRTSEVATNVTQEQIEQLPSPSRNFLDLAALAPGVTITEDRINSGSGFRTFSAGAQSASNVNLFIDGASLKNDLTGGGVAGQDASRGNPFPRNAIQEYRVVTQNFKAEYQKASSAIITATTRSGGNRWSGNAFAGYQDKGLLALDTFQIRDKNANPAGFSKPDYSRYLAGLSVGGPLIRNRLFFFGSYEGNYQNRANAVNITPPTGFPALDSVNLTQFNGTITSPFRETLLFGKLTYSLGNNSSVEASFNNRHETDVRDFGGQTAAQAALNYRQDIALGILKYSYFSGAWLNEASVTYQRFRRNPSPDNSDLPSREFQNGTVTGCCSGIGRIGSFLSIQDFTQKRLGFRDDLTYT
ncbi:MAG: carboxypeptidase-like regulatory domain-containing protein, partial [Gemmatimonadales bacterium]|nr:carboxypeptidase-like regulatory domain-containing protein [Gemmatimonadales bacterium]